MSKLKHIVAVLLLGLALLDCIDVCMITSNSEQIPFSKNFATAIALHHHHHEDLANTYTYELSTKLESLPNTWIEYSLPLFYCYSCRIWQPPQ